MPTQSDIEHLLASNRVRGAPGARRRAAGAADSERRSTTCSRCLPIRGRSCSSSHPNWERERGVHPLLAQPHGARLAPADPGEDRASSGTATSAPTCPRSGRAELMQQQIDLFRYQGHGQPAVAGEAMSTQVAMIRYLDNNDNRRTSPNQNFGRELMELFLLGVGNYTEADVEASTAAWTGHTDNWETDAYVWRADWHDNTTKTFLGRDDQPRQGAGGPEAHGHEVIDTMLGAGKVPAAATNVANRGRETRAVSAEFISRKLWTFFAGTTIRRRGDRRAARRRDRQRLRDHALGARAAAAPRVLRRQRQAGTRAITGRPRRRPAGGDRQAVGGRRRRCG